MYNQKDILAALQNGEDPQVIANGFADALNAAIKEKAEADRKAAEAQAAAEAAKLSQAEKIEVAEGIVTDILDFMEEYYPEVYDEGMRKVTGKDIVEAFDQARDEVVKMQPVLDDLTKMLEALEAAHPEVKDTNKNVDKKIVSDPINDFLRNNGLLF